MTENKGILIKNIYYMLTYAFQVLRQSNYDDVATEDFENIYDMFAAILGNGVAGQLKHGLYREYVDKRDNLSTLRGKLELRGTINNRINNKQLLTCEFDELSENNIFNRILKTTMLLLLRQPSVKAKNKAVLKKDVVFFHDIEEVDPLSIRWDRIQFQRNNQYYRMLLNVCRLILDGMIMSTDSGSFKMASFIDEQNMNRLYEKFILEYYRYHHRELDANPDSVNWNLDNDNSKWLPAMKTDITLKGRDGRVLIIDAKYYGQQMQTNFDVRSFRNANLYQIYTYVKNWDKDHSKKVGGMLLYAKTSEEFQPSNKFSMDGNMIAVDKLDLSQPFSNIARKLEEIVEEFFTEEMNS